LKAFVSKVTVVFFLSKPQQKVKKYGRGDCIFLTTGLLREQVTGFYQCG